MTTARDLLTDALGDVGVLDPNEEMTGDMAAHGLRTLNRIIDRWNARRLFVYAVKDVQASFAGSSASIGPGLTINTAHPLRLEDGCYYVKSGISYPLPVWDREYYSRQTLKAQSGEYPQGVYYDRDQPGTVKVWPVPTSALEYHFQVLVQMTAFADLDTVYTFPPGYEDALFYTLCERLPNGYNLQADPTSVAEAVKARAAIKVNNTVVPTLNVGPVGPRWNIYSN